MTRCLSLPSFRKFNANAFILKQLAKRQIQPSQDTYATRARLSIRPCTVS